MFGKHLKSKIIHFLPGLVILILSAVSFYAISHLIDGHAHIDSLHHHGDISGDISHTSSSMKQQHVWAYGSVLLLGLFGFTQIVFSAYKLRELKVFDEEKQETLGLLKNRLEALDATRDGIFIMNANDEITYMNKSFCNIAALGDVNRGEYIGKTWADIFSRSDCDIIEEDILPELFEDGFWVGEFQMIRNDRTVLHTEMSITRLPDGGLIGTVQDASYRKQAEEQKKNLEDQFYQAQKMEAIGRLAGGIAHDFNNILAAMNGYAEFLVDDLEETSEQRKFAENILQAGMQARELVDQMLAFSRRSDSTKNILDIAKSVEKVLSMVNATMPKTIELTRNIDVEQAFISGNQTQISQLIMNLCVNAKDAMEDTHGTLSIALKSVDEVSVDIDGVVKQDLPDPKDPPYMHVDDLGVGRSRLVLGHLSENEHYIKLCVCDTGTGISRVIMERIFEPFYTTKSVDKGTGLGLATVHGVLTSHQGFMLIDSTLGKGTKCELYFPLREDIAVEQTAKAHKTQAKSSTQSGINVLLIEDQKNVRDMIIKMLDRMGHNTFAAVSGLEGLDMIRENPDGFDVVITDHNMPKMTGLEMINQIYTDLPDLPFILLSGYSEKKMQDMIDGHPAIKAMLRKPVSKDVLAERIESVLNVKIAAEV